MRCKQLTEVLQTHDTLGRNAGQHRRGGDGVGAWCDAATIAISIGGQPATAAMTGTVALELDMVQYDNDDGPCLTSFRTASTLRLDLYEQGEAFPHIAIAAQRVGIRAVLSVPSHLGGETIATLNLYSRTGPVRRERRDRRGGARRAGRHRRQPLTRVRSRPQPSSKKPSATPTTTPRSRWPPGCSSAARSAPASKPKALLRQAAAEDEQSILQIARRIIEQHDSSARATSSSRVGERR